MAVGNGVIAAGQDGSCCVMKFKRSQQEEETKATVKEGEALYWIFASICIQVQAFSNVVAVAILLFFFLQGTGSRNLMSGNVLEKGKKVERMKVPGLI